MQNESGVTSVRELKRQVATSLFERLLLSNGHDNKERVLPLARTGNAIAKPADLIQDPYVFEFPGLPEAAGQLNMYLNYYVTEGNDADDNPPIGIIFASSAFLAYPGKRDLHRGADFYSIPLRNYAIKRRRDDFRAPLLITFGFILKLPEKQSIEVPFNQPSGISSSPNTFKS